MALIKEVVPEEISPKNTNFVDLVSKSFTVFICDIYSIFNFSFII